MGIIMDATKLSNNLKNLYANIAMDFKKLNNYLGDLYVSIVNFKWLYGS